MITRFVGSLAFTAYMSAVLAEELTISPGGAALLLGVSRQRVYQIVDTYPDVRAWSWAEREKIPASAFEVSVADLVAYGVRRGKTVVSDYGLSFSRLEELVCRSLEARQANDTVVA